MISKYRYSGISFFFFLVCLVRFFIRMQIHWIQCMVEYFVKFFARPSSNSKNYERVIFTFNYKRSFCINNSGINSASFVVSNLFVDGISLNDALSSFLVNLVNKSIDQVACCCYYCYYYYKVSESKDTTFDFLV